MSGVSTPLQVMLNNGGMMMVPVLRTRTRQHRDMGDLQLTMDAHPIHLHLVRFEVVNREVIGIPGTIVPEPWKAASRTPSLRIRARSQGSGPL